MTEAHPLQPLFAPRSVAIIGASSNPTRVSGRILQILKDSGYSGKISPVNPSHLTVQGISCYASMNDILEPVDLVAIAVPAAAVYEAVANACQAGARSIAIFSGGFAETGSEGATRQLQLAALADVHGVRLLGPNCMGIFNARENVFVTFASVFSSNWVPPGPISIVTQSGAFGAYFYTRARASGVGLGIGITTGNEADITLADGIAYLACDTQTRVILVYLEGCRDMSKLSDAIDMARMKDKTIVILKVGMTPQGRETAMFHTGSPIEDDSLFEELFQRYGVWRVKSMEEMFDVSMMLANGPPVTGPRLGIITVSGGVGALMCDDALRAGLIVPRMEPSTYKSLQVELPFAYVRNPVDVTGAVLSDPTLVDRVLKILAEGGGVDAVIGFFAGMGVSPSSSVLVQSLIRCTKAYPHIRFIAVMLTSHDVRNELQEQGIAVFDDPTRAINSLAAVYECSVLRFNHYSAM